MADWRRLRRVPIAAPFWQRSVYWQGTPFCEQGGSRSEERAARIEEWKAIVAKLTLSPVDFHQPQCFSAPLPRFSRSHSINVSQGMGLGRGCGRGCGCGHGVACNSEVRFSTARLSAVFSCRCLFPSLFYLIFFSSFLISFLCVFFWRCRKMSVAISLCSRLSSAWAFSLPRVISRVPYRLSPVSPRVFMYFSVDR